ncbi:hypothetical protein DSM110093_03815 (plasmid) [Sulfitobacter sp. DSM 110093]|uniref:hypothetical protein n=1 Tax=Sulfitobacter sp. DSM 110093 TaxID=2883127 RepID=UPI001FAC9502|nr:hypothetical protein [Sulfitobacter sp. DSM 110093]UOA33719.1 hypothetical protein DSM110093_03554 [Sulfitobacter sp. DSM 110093]UOA33980.1 hypothetical protein DSM110093_03815 [Sulfitobacter sp. DSM 110093]
MVSLTNFFNVTAPRTLFAVLLCFGLVAGSATAQEDTSVERSFAVALIRDVMIAINHGNWTGNYTVLRDYASRDFSEANDPTRLAGLFAPVREAGVDMLPVLVEEPEILNSQVAAGGEQIRLTGYFPVLPEHISFDLVFINEKARWVLLDVSVGKFDAIEEAEKPLVESD